jgi:hypothetical protein
VESILGLIEHDAGVRFEYFSGDFETTGHARVLHDQQSVAHMANVTFGSAQEDKTLAFSASYSSSVMTPRAFRSASFAS